MFVKLSTKVNSELIGNWDNNSFNSLQLFCFFFFNGLCKTSLFYSHTCMYISKYKYTYIYALPRSQFSFSPCFAGKAYFEITVWITVSFSLHSCILLLKHMQTFIQKKYNEHFEEKKQPPGSSLYSFSGIRRIQDFSYCFILQKELTL